MTAVRFDDSDIIWFDYTDIDLSELDNLEISHFDVFNIPFEEVKMKNYFTPTFYKCDKSSTGYCAMFVNRNKNIYKTAVKTLNEFNNKYNK